MSALDDLAALLRGAPLTAKQIAAHMRCSIPTAYARVEALKRRGDAVYSLRVPLVQTGPKPVAYGIR